MSSFTGPPDPPRRTPDSMDSQLQEIWTEVLRVSAGSDDDFFDLGGDSLSAARIVTRVRERLGVSLTILDVFDAPTLSEFTTVAHRVLVSAD